MKTREYNWYDTKRKIPLYGIQVFSEGIWMYYAEDGKPCIYETPKERIIMTDEEFDGMFGVMTYREKFRWLSNNTYHITLQNGNAYSISNEDDLSAVVEQELYMKLTGRE